MDRSRRPPGPAPGDPATWRAFVRRWGVAIASLASGLLTLLFFRRGVDRAPPGPGSQRSAGRVPGYSRKSDFPPDALGCWTVDVVTASGQLIGRLRFRVDA
jgi:hypothetical protein